MQLQDSTLREGEQRSGVSYSVEQKVAAARLLDELGVDVIQVGFPIARDGTAEVIAQLDTDADLVGLARALERDVDACVEAGVDRLGFGVPASDVQREAILGVDEAGVLDTVTSMYDYAADHGLPVSVSAMDAFRADPAFLAELIGATDADAFGLLDTVGIATPATVTDYLGTLEADPDRLSVHFHRDLGVATANVLTAAAHGVASADVTVGGIGDRVGNTALEEVVVAGTLSPEPLAFDVAADRLVPLCLEILDVLDEEIPPHKAVLGETAFEHESGMHTATMLDRPAAYEPFDPARFGGERRLLFGPSSGRGAARRLLERAGVEEPDDERVAAFVERLRGLEQHVGLDEATAMAAESATAD